MKNFFYKILLPIALFVSTTMAFDFISRPSTYHVILGLIAIGTNSYFIITFVTSFSDFFITTKPKDHNNE